MIVDQRYQLTLPCLWPVEPGSLAWLTLALTLITDFLTFGLVVRNLTEVR